MWHKEFRLLLQQKLEAVQKKNPSFTLRSLARRITLSPGALSEILQGKRRVSLRKAHQILESIQATPEEKDRILAPAKALKQNKRAVLPPEAREGLNRWHYFALLAAHEMMLEPPPPAGELAKRLDLPLKDVEHALHWLQSQGLLQKGPNGRWVSQGPAWAPDKDAPLAVHLDGLALAEKAARELPGQACEFSALTFPADAEKMELARREIQRFQDRMAKLMSASEHVDTVFRLSLQLFPVDQWHKLKQP
ncbi:MAG: TIGR02147 family protein [Bdellovibrionaceae bacterium]|nr:TIGR02147 family protein [Pseudobdellovibrionaceae bacterium]MBX3033283.1 TIGR02147 family protein [Pseudobdellovibrionaceae bacterium]